MGKIIQFPNRWHHPFIERSDYYTWPFPEKYPSIFLCPYRHHKDGKHPLAPPQGTLPTHPEPDKKLAPWQCDKCSRNYMQCSQCKALARLVTYHPDLAGCAMDATCDCEK